MKMSILSKKTLLSGLITIIIPFGLNYNIMAEDVKTSNIENIVSNDLENMAHIRRLIRSDLIKASKIEYESEGEEDYWQTPKETEDSKKGDCEDMAFYLNRLLKEDGIKNRVVFGYADLTKKEDKRIMHAWVEYKLNEMIYILDPVNKIMIKRNNLDKSYYLEIIKDYLIEKLKDYNVRSEN